MKIQYNSSSITDLKISGSMKGQTVGGICGEIRIAAYNNPEIFVKIENCVSDIEIDGDTVGGIIGSISRVQEIV